MPTLRKRKQIILKLFGYDYILIEGQDRCGKYPQPCFWGLENYCLKAIKKNRKEK